MQHDSILRPCGRRAIFIPAQLESAADRKIPDSDAANSLPLVARPQTVFNAIILFKGQL